MFKEKKLKLLLLTVVLSLTLLFGCSHGPVSSRDISHEELVALAHTGPGTDFSSINNSREPANWASSCLANITGFFKPKEIVQNQSFPELTQLTPEIKTFPNGKKYTQYVANINVMNKYPDYDEFLKKSVEVIFEPADPFGHINLRIVETIYSFNYIKSVSINKFAPRMKKSSIEDMPSSTGFVFQVEKEKIELLKKEIDAFYNSSASHNVPPFDAYSPMLKIVETDGVMGKKLKYETTSPKHGNTQELKGKIVQENNLFFLDTEKGIKLPLSKKGDDFYLQSYSCSSSAEYILQNFFGINVSYANSAKSLNQSLLKGNINESISPIAVIKYYEE
jgi:hypothetical protein